MNEINMGSTASSSLSWPILSQIVNLHSGMTFTSTSHNYHLYCHRIKATALTATKDKH